MKAYVLTYNGVNRTTDFVFYTERKKRTDYKAMMAILNTHFMDDIFDEQTVKRQAQLFEVSDPIVKDGAVYRTYTTDKGFTGRIDMYDDNTKAYYI